MEAVSANPMIGLLVGLRHALWVPIERKEQLKGIILAGSLGKQPAIPRERVESVAAELALALGLEEEQRIARLHEADFTVVRRFLAGPSYGASLETRLSSLVQSCTATPGNGEGSGAAFAVIGALRQGPEKSGDGFSMAVRWRSGEESWTRAMESEPLASLRRRAPEIRAGCGSEAEKEWKRG